MKFFNKKYVLFSILILFIAACTTYEFQPDESPTGSVVSADDSDNGGISILPGDPESAEPIIDDESMQTSDDNKNEDSKVLSNETNNVSSDEVMETKEPAIESVNSTDANFTEEDMMEGEFEAIEGELIDLGSYVRANVNDPDADDVELGFTAPFDESGVWQTKEGDAGFYSVIVTATDNKGSLVTKQVSVKVRTKNTPPALIIEESLSFNEGDLIKLDPDVSDIDGDQVVISYRGWMTSNEKQTGFDDAGDYQVRITATDGKATVTKEVQIIVKNVNRRPKFTILSGARITVTEGELIEVKTQATDEDGDDVVITYSPPLDSNGKWQTSKGDESSQVVEVTAFDGVNKVTQEVLLEVIKKNSVPLIEAISVTPKIVELQRPGDKVIIEIDVIASDPDGDKLQITYSGFMNSDVKTVNYGEPGGLKVVTVRVSDGTDSVTQNVEFEMNNWPCFYCNN